MGSGSAVVDTSNEKTPRQSISQNLLTYVLAFAKCVIGAGRILGRHKDISFQCFTVESVVTWTTPTWTGLSSQTLWKWLVAKESIKIVNFDIGTWCSIIIRWGVFCILNSGDVHNNVTWWISFTDTLR